MNTYFYTDIEQEGEPFVFVVDAPSQEEADSSFEREMGFYAHMTSNIKCECEENTNFPN